MVQDFSILICLSPAICAFLIAYRHQIPKDTFRRILTPAINCTKSSNPLVRENAVNLFAALIKNAEEAAQLVAVEDLLALPKAGKTTGVDQRICLYGMFLHVKPSASVSPNVLSTLATLLVKEVSDPAIVILRDCLAAHLAQAIQSGSSTPQDVLTMVPKEMTSTKSSTRRAFCAVVGTVFWELRSTGDAHLMELDRLAKAIAPGLEANLKNVAASPLAATIGSMEGYVSVFVLLEWSRLPALQIIATKNPTLQSLSQAGAKPSFVLWDKVYLKLTDQQDEVWLIRTAEVVVLRLRDELKKGEALRSAFYLVR